MLKKEDIPLTNNCHPNKKNDLHCTVADYRLMMLAGLSLQQMDVLWELTTREEVEFTVMGFACVVNK